ncbi:MAG: bifunctional UDP-N-acetylmuramoyl-tripeptide:D-alanyl-D-alanine ligase/alanine racemase [Bacteroidales bacterium]|nr:bifunctional UDP-N-acetylmuramoyl-tripeptide:D-alanyl-D-alanine ligase/alanine racemase [Bacteroidales bacterium]
MVRNPKSYNSQLGVPLSVWLIDKENNLGIFEAGISMPGEMEKLEEIIQPEVGIFTNIGEAHQENFRDTSQKIREKLILFRRSRRIVYCRDQQMVHKEILTQYSKSGKELFRWSENENAEVIITKNRLENQTVITARFKDQSFEVTIPFTDPASFENAAHVLTYLISEGETGSEVLNQFESLPVVAMRLEIKKGFNSCTLINDSYNSDLNSLIIALDALVMQSQHASKTVILSDLLQTGQDETELYSRIAQWMNEKKITKFIGIGEKLSNNKYLFGSSSLFFPSTSAFLEHMNGIEFNREAILIKGSRSFGFEKISAAFEEKKHLTRLEINLNALIDNLNYYRSLLKSDTQIMVMVKALSYGSGSYEIANMLQFQRVHYLGVAIADEGAELRKAGIHLPIMVMNPDPVSFETMIQNHLEPELYNFTTLTSFQDMALRNLEHDYPVHIKIDTGMHRLGFSWDETEKLCGVLKNCPNIKVNSVFSHLAASDEEVHDEFTSNQIERFKKGCETIQNALGYPFIRHILNSSGIERFTESQFEMVRLGIGLYGFSPGKQNKLKNVGTLKSTISQIKRVSENETIGYGRKGKAGKGKTVGIVPIGYADGYNRKLGNGIGKMLVNNKFAPVVGNVCMDMCMIDLDGINAHEGDEVIVFGERFPASELANLLGTIPYEILTGISTRVKGYIFNE